MFAVLWWIFCGWLAGHVAVWLYPPKNPMPFWTLVGLGISGSFIGGMVAAILSGEHYAPGGMLASVAGALVVIAAYRWYTEES